MPLLTSDRQSDDVVRTTAASSRRGRVWKTPIRPDAAHRGRIWRTPARPDAAHRGRVWRSPVLPSATLDDRAVMSPDVVSPWPAARRGRVWRSPLRPGATWSRTGAAVAVVVALLIAAGGGIVAQLDDFAPDAASTPVAAIDPVVTDSADAVSLGTVADQIGASALWAQGITGAGVNVAVIDTGVAPVPALQDVVVAAVDFTPDVVDPTRRFSDGNGHGTHLAGIIAGNDRATGFTGIAPGAGIVSVKVADREGTVTPSSVITGIDWVIAHADELDIRVINLALDTNDGSDYRTSALAAAVERAWAAGIVVVTAAGNDGPEVAGLSLPASDPFVIAVAGLDTDDSGAFVTPDWASRGDDARHPDIAAPGAHIVSLRAPSSIADLEHPEGYVDELLFKGTGSSQAAAVASGGIALMLEAQPELTPDQVKAALGASAQAVDADPARVGAGSLRVDLAIDSVIDVPAQQWSPADQTATVPHLQGAFATPAGRRGLVARGLVRRGLVARGLVARGLVGRGLVSAWAGSAWAGSAWAGPCVGWFGVGWFGVGWYGVGW